jgi:hypothetical protein
VYQTEGLPATISTNLYAQRRSTRPREVRQQAINVQQKPFESTGESCTVTETCSRRADHSSRQQRSTCAVSSSSDASLARVPVGARHAPSLRPMADAQNGKARDFPFLSARAGPGPCRAHVGRHALARATATACVYRTLQQPAAVAVLQWRQIYARGVAGRAAVSAATRAPPLSAGLDSWQ